MTPRIGVVLQARMGSSRLPGKVMRVLAGQPMLGHILDRLQRAVRPDLLIVATSDLPADAPVVKFASARGLPVFRGSEADVLDRYYQTSRAFELDHVVRATADNPFVDPEELDRLVAHHLATQADYTHAFGQLPIGVGVECFTMDALARSWQEGHAPHHREHVNEYIPEHPDRFRIEELDVPADKRASDLRLTVDTPEDFARAEALYGAVPPGMLPSTQDAIRLCATLSV